MGRYGLVIHTACLVHETVSDPGCVFGSPLVPKFGKVCGGTASLIRSAFVRSAWAAGARLRAEAVELSHERGITV